MRGVKIETYTTPQIAAHLERLLASGLYGKDVGAVAEQLIAREIETMLLDGRLDYAESMTSNQKEQSDAG